MSTSIFDRLPYRFSGQQQVSAAQGKSERTYKALVCREQDKKNIIELITSVANNNKFSLLLKQNHLRSLGAQIKHVHPLKFLSVGMGTPYLKSCYVLIFGDYFKRNAAMEGLRPSLTREADKGKLDQYLAPFAKEMGVSVEKLRSFTDTRDWEGLVNFLMNPSISRT